ncbi:hypothetical protein D0T57_02500 [Dysgonomonas sp. 511]|nr:hypothetical protein [Dysgonomonas sp. 511]
MPARKEIQGNKSVRCSLCP